MTDFCRISDFQFWVQKWQKLVGFGPARDRTFFFFLHNWHFGVIFEVPIFLGTPFDPGSGPGTLIGGRGGVTAFFPASPKFPASELDPHHGVLITVTYFYVLVMVDRCSLKGFHRGFIFWYPKPQCSHLLVVANNLCLFGLLYSFSCRSRR